MPVTNPSANDQTNFTDIRQKTFDLNKIIVTSPGTLKNTWALGDYYWYPSNGNFNLRSKLTIPLIGNVGTILNDIFDFFENPSRTINTTPRILLWEFEPTPYYRTLINIYSNLWKGLVDLIQPPTDSSGFSNFLDKLQGIFSLSSLEKALSNIDGVGSFSGNDAEKYIIQIPRALYSNLVAGTFLNKFELPYYGNEFLDAKGDEGWTKTTLQDTFLGGEITGFLQRFGLGGIDAPISPRFQLERGGPSADKLSASIYLYNDTLDHFISNFKFLCKFCSGAFWVQSGFLQRGSNFYRVEIPGRLIYYLCTMNIKVTCVGKSRYLQSGATEKLFFADLPPILYDNDETLIPDGYKLEIELQSILPNNFNTFMFMLLNDQQFAGGGTKLNIVQELVQSLVNNIPGTAQSKVITQ